MSSPPLPQALHQTISSINLPSFLPSTWFLQILSTPAQLFQQRCPGVPHTSGHCSITRSHHQHLSWTTTPCWAHGLQLSPHVSMLTLLLSCFQLMSFQRTAEAFLINPYICDLTLRTAELHQGQAILPVLYHNVQQRVCRRSKDGINTNIAMKILQKRRHRIYPWETPLLTSSSLRAVLAVPPISLHFPCSSFLSTLQLFLESIPPAYTSPCLIGHHIECFKTEIYCVYLNWKKKKKEVV